MSSFYVENFGCRATQADGAAIEQQFRDRGFDRATRPAAAKIVVLNTCAVTASAEQDARAALRRKTVGAGRGDANPRRPSHNGIVRRAVALGSGSD